MEEWNKGGGGRGGGTETSGCRWAPAFGQRTQWSASATQMSKWLDANGVSCFELARQQYLR